MHVRRFTVLAAGLVLAGTMGARAQQPASPQTPAGPLAPEQYKNIQVLKDVPADQFDVTMQYFMAATGFSCAQCHQRDAATGQMVYDADTRLKTTARRMIQLVQTVNAGEFGARINCGTCHQGRNQPAGLQPAQPYTPEQLAQLAARQGGNGPGAGGATGGAARGAGAGAPGAAGQTPSPAVDDVLNKYLDALGGRAALEALTSRTMTGTVVNRAGQSMAITIEEKGDKIRQSIANPQGEQVSVWNGSAAWGRFGDTVADLPGFRGQQASRLNDLRRAIDLKSRYSNLTVGRPTRLAQTPGATPVDVTLLQGSTFPNVTERLYFETATGLLLRRQVITRTPLNGALIEIYDYSNYKPVAGVQMPFTIKQNNWNSLDTITIANIQANTAIDDARFTRPVK